MMRTGYSWKNKLLFIFMLSLGAVAPALAGDMSCTGRSEKNGDDFNYANDFDFGDGNQTNDIGVIDGNDPYTMSLISTVSTLQIDGDCTIKNFTQDNPFPVTNINYWTPNPKQSYLIVFDNVYYTGGMSCSNIPHKLWLTNGTTFTITNSCQDYFIPVEKIDKQVPGPTASIGVPFTYTLKIPVMYDPTGLTSFPDLGSPNALGNIHVTDDLTAPATVVPGVANSGAEMTLVGDIRAYDRDNPAGAWVVTNNGDNKHLDFTLPDVPAGSQIIVEIPVVLDAGNTPGWQFINTAKWEFSRFIAMDMNADGVVDPGEGRFFDPLPGEWGVSPTMTIAEPNLVVNKTTPATAVNPANTITYTIDVQNTGGWEAWNVRVEDIIPQNTVPASAPAMGMCETDPTTFGTGLSAQILNADGTLNRALAGAGADYTLAWSTTGPDACKIILTLTDNGGAIGPNEHLVVTYQTALDSAFSSGGAGDLINVAGATQWFNANSTVGGRIQYLGGGTGVLTDGTPGVPDFQDNASVTAAVSGYYFEKTVSNLATGDNPATGAAPGDTLRYRLHLFNVDQTISNISIADPLDAASFVLPPNIVTCGVVGPVAAPVNPVCSFDTVTNTLQVAGSGGAPLDLPQGDDLVIEFDVTLQAGLANGAVVSNQAQLTASGITSVVPAPVSYPSDDPNVNSVSDPTILGDEDPTDITIVTPGALSKANPANTNVTIGQQFSYQITVPAAAVPMPLYDVRILDTLPANLRFVSASAVVGATTLTLSDTNGGADNNLVLLEQATGLDIPANQQAIVTLTVEVRNDAINQGGVTSFGNTASYTYSRVNGSAAPQLSGGAGATPAPMTVVEPTLTILSKDVSFISPASKVLGTDPATVGDVLQYVVTIDNTSADTTAFDVNVVDTLPPELALYSGFTPTATINGVPVGTFVATPAGAPGGPLTWGQGNGDGSLDIPPGGQLVLTYQVTVLSATAPSIVNSVTVDWTSLDGLVPAERTGTGCPAFTAPNDYCAGPLSSTPIATQDNTAISKAWVSDTYAEPVAGTDPIVRVGDTVTYELTVSLQEYTTRQVVVTDTLPQGMVLNKLPIITPGPGSSFSYTVLASPAIGDSNLRWEFGDITNTPNGSPLDQLVIQYEAIVVTDPAPAGVDTTSSNLLTNTATLTYTGYDPANPALIATETIEVRQPQMRAITKVDLGTGRVGTGTSAVPYQVDIATDVMNFRLESCNDGQAPAYGVVITDQLSQWLNEGDLAAAPVVTISDGVTTTTLGAGTDFLYTAPARGGLMQIALQDSAPVNPGDCVTVDYTIGFHTDLTIQTSWSNEARLTQYRSLPLAQTGRLYDASASFAQVWMSNVVNVTPLPLTKTLTSATEVTIGQDVVYQITLPAMNVARDNVVLTDTLHGALAYVSDAVTLNGSPLAIAPVQSGQTLSWSFGTIPAGQSAVITLTTRVANNDLANAGTSITNIASYTYTGLPVGTDTSGSSAPVAIIEPLVTVSNSVPVTSPNAGDLLTYTVTFNAAGAGVGDIYADAFDLAVEDSLGLGLAYELNSATLNGSPLAEPAITGDGVGTAQTLTWSLASGIDIDLTEGTTATITYQVRVLGSVVPGQALSNSVVGRWSSLNGDLSAIERTGSGAPVVNDYVTQPATTELWIGDSTSISKAWVADDYNEPTAGTDPIVRVGDTVSYDLTLYLQEGTTEAVVVGDTLPQGMELVSFTIDNLSTSCSYTMQSVPVAGATGTLTWDFGTIINTPDGSPLDPIVIHYVARVVTAAAPTGVGLATSILLDNQATLSYTGGDPATYPARLTASERIEVRQPQMRAITKVDLGTGRVGTGTALDPYQVDIATDVMNFQLSSCNDGLAPAYGVQISDLLANELDETSITTPVVKVNGTALAGADYVYTPPVGRGGTMLFQLNTPVDPGLCVTVDYSIGFHLDVAPNSIWANQAQLTQYASLPAGGRSYTATATAQVSMTNVVSVVPLSKTLVSPAEATIGDEVVYHITVPATPMNAALDSVVVTDVLHGALEYVSATAVDNAGVAVALTDNSVAPDNVNLTIAQIPAGDQVMITLTARVANNDQANAGTSITNSASYSYTGMPAGTNTTGSSGAVTIIEPAVALSKTVANLTNPGVAPKPGDVLRYSLTLSASGGVAGDNFSEAFDLLIDDSMSLGLAYQNGTATVDGTGNTITDPTVTGDGVTTAQTLTWSLADATADIDVAEGSTVTLTYDVLVLNSALPGQNLSNSATVQWTGQDGINAFERTGANDVPVNDYFTGPATTTVMTELAVSFVKSVVNVTTGQNPGANASPGDTLHYTLVVTNQSLAPVTNASLVDELAAEFAAGTLQLIGVSDPAADSTNTNASGGANGTGIVDIRNLNLAALGNPGDAVTIEFEATLVGVINSGTSVLNQAQLSGDNLSAATSNVTTTLISSAPAFEVWKTSQDLTGDPNVLLAGDTLRYTITVKNIGNENAVNTVLRDQIPLNTTYVADSTTLNGMPFGQPDGGVSPLQNGMPIQSPADTTSGAMLADASTTTTNVATITFDVVVNSNAVGGTRITNQARVNADGAGTSGMVLEQLSDDPGTVNIIGDPTVDVVGNLPWIDAHKTVTISTDNGSPGSVDPNDVLTYTIVVYNNGAVPATGVTLTDTVPQYTSYVANSTQLNGVAVPDPSANVSALQNGMPVNSSGSPSGTIAAGASAVVTFQVQVDATVPVGTVPPTEISNQGVVSSNEQGPELTDDDGIDSNGDLPTVVVVGNAQLLSITKEVFDINGGLTEAGDELDYVITVQNTGSVTATDVRIIDTLPAGVQYLPGFTTLNGSANGVTFSAGTLTADYATTYGNLPVGATATLRFRVVIDALAIGASVTNTGLVEWNGASQSDSASATFTVGGIPGMAQLSGRVWHDTNNDQQYNGTELPLAGWSVEVYRNTTLLGTVLTDANGLYQINGLAANDTTTDEYSLRFAAPGSGSTTAALGLADSIYTNGLQSITQITVSADSVNQNLNLPLLPNGVVYDAIARTPVAGAVVTMLDAASQQPLPASCFDDVAQQNQVTLASGYYRFDLNFSDATCTSGGEYFIQVSHPSTNYEQRISLYVPPQSDLNTASFSVPACLGSTADAVPATTAICEAAALETAPPASVVAGSPGTNYHLHLVFNNTQIPGTSQLFNNHIPLDPVLDAAVAITKTAGRVSVSRSEMVPYTITVNNSYLTTLQDLRIVDTFPAGFKYVKGSARFDGQPLEPTIVGNQLHWENINLATDAQHTIQLVFIVGAGVSEGEYINRANVVHILTGDNLSGEASATVRVVPDPTFDCTDVTGKVFDDKNLNGHQDEGEAGLPGARLVTARGLIVTADEYGRFHITCAVTPNEDRGSNFILKLDDRSLPSGYRVTSENPRVQRATRGKMMKFNFGATIHRVVRMDVADGVFERKSEQMRPQWLPRINLLLAELQKAPAVLRLSYLADVEDESLVKDRVEAVKSLIADAWDELNCCYRLTIETEVYWRRGAPPNRSGVID